MENKITVELKFDEELNMGMANNWGPIKELIFKALAKLAEEKGIKREEETVGRCITLVRYPGICRFAVDSSD